MVRARRKGSERSATRAVLIKAAEELMIEEGYAAVTARRLGARAGLKSMLLHYYFEDMDELFAAVIRHRGEVGLERMVNALAADQPLKTMWDYGNDEKNLKISSEFVALATHRPAVRAEVKRFGEQQRIVKTAAIARHFELHKIKPAAPPVAYALLLSSLSSTLLLESLNDIDMGHAEIREWVGAWLANAGAADLPGMQPRGLTSAKRADRSRSTEAPPAERRAHTERGTTGKAKRPARKSPT